MECILSTHTLLYAHLEYGLPAYLDAVGIGGIPRAVIPWVDDVLGWRNEKRGRSVGAVVVGGRGASPLTSYCPCGTRSTELKYPFSPGKRATF